MAFIQKKRLTLQKGRVTTILYRVTMAITREWEENIDYAGRGGFPKVANVIIAFMTTLLPWLAVRRDTL